MAPAQIVQLSEQVFHPHGVGSEDPSPRCGSPLLGRRQTTVDGFPYHSGNRSPPLTGQSVHALVAFVIEEQL